MPSSSLLDLKKLSEIGDDDSFSQAIEKSGGKNRIASVCRSTMRFTWIFQALYCLTTSEAKPYCKKVDNESGEEASFGRLVGGQEQGTRPGFQEVPRERHRAVE